MATQRARDRRYTLFLGSLLGWIFQDSTQANSACTKCRDLMLMVNGQCTNVIYYFLLSRREVPGWNSSAVDVYICTVFCTEFITFTKDEQRQIGLNAETLPCISVDFTHTIDLPVPNHWPDLLLCPLHSDHKMLEQTLFPPYTGLIFNEI